jgi:hypothetical protein
MYEIIYSIKKATPKSAHSPPLKLIKRIFMQAIKIRNALFLGPENDARSYVRAVKPILIGISCPARTGNYNSKEAAKRPKNGHKTANLSTRNRKGFQNF